MHLCANLKHNSRKIIIGRRMLRADVIEKNEACNLYWSHLLREPYLFRDKTRLAKESERARIVTLCQYFLQCHKIVYFC
jgi:hypothetical protein